MNDTQPLQLAISALGACIVAIGWLVIREFEGLKTGLRDLTDKMERVLVRMEAHETRIFNLEE